MIELTVTAFANISFQDDLGLEAAALNAMFRGDGLNAAETRVYTLTNSSWDRVRPRIKDMEQRRVPALDAAGAVIPGSTMPAIVWGIVPTPSRNPRIHQIEETAVISTSVDGQLTVRGVGLLNGTNAVFEVLSQLGDVNPGMTGVRRFNPAQKVLRLTAVDVGPLGNRIGIRILPPSGAGSVTVAMQADGVVLITVTPAAAGPTATAVAAQINGSAAASFVTALALVGAALVPPTQLGLVGVPTAPQVVTPTHKNMYNGDGGGIARLDLLVSGTDPTNRLRVVARKGGNGGNRIALILRMNQGGNSVSVTGTVITVNRTGATETLANLASAINGNATAAGLVAATAIGVGSLGAVAQKFLYGGAGPDFSATVGGAPATITSHDDTAIVMSVTAAALVTAGVSDMEHAMLQILAGTTQLQGEVRPGSYPTTVTARVRAPANVTLSGPGANVDGVAMAAGQRFWADAQTAPAEDGLYIWTGAATAATRAPEVPAGRRVSGLLVSVTEGTDAGKLAQVSNVPGADIVGTSNLATVFI